jgi:predicted nuclease of predicted toxin-antitoxin system
MILADENIDHSLINAIRALDIEVYSVYELQRGTPDASIIELSRNPPRIILTEDKDFGEWVFAHHVKDISVILLRYHFQDTALIKTILIKILSEQLPSLFGKFTTLTVTNSCYALAACFKIVSSLKAALRAC